MESPLDMSWSSCMKDGMTHEGRVHTPKVDIHTFGARRVPKLGGGGELTAQWLSLTMVR